MNEPDRYGKPGYTSAAAALNRAAQIPAAPQLPAKPVVINSTADIQRVCKMAADAVTASAAKVAGDVLAAADAVQAIADFINKDAEKLADYVREHSTTLTDRIGQFALAGDTVARSHRDSKEHILTMGGVPPAERTRPSEPSNPNKTSESV